MWGRARTAAIFWPQISGLYGRLRGRRREPAAAPAHVDGDALYSSVQARMDEPDDLHKRGVLSDDEYAAEQSKLIDNI